MAAWLRSSKEGLLRGSRYLFIMVLSLSPLRLMHRGLVHKEESSPKRRRWGKDDTGSQRVADMLLYGLTLGLLSILEVRGALGSKFKAQSYSLWGWREIAKDLLNISPKLWYSGETKERAGGETEEEGWHVGNAECRKWVWQKVLQLAIDVDTQSMCTLWNFNQGGLDSISEEGEDMT